MNAYHKRFFLLFFCAARFLLAVPPPIPSAGIVERELEKEYDAQPLLQNKEVPLIQMDIPKENLQIPEGEKVFLRKIRVQGF